MKTERFGYTKDGQEITRYVLENQNGLRAAFLDLGAVISNIWMPDRNGRIDDIVHGYDTVQGYEVNVPSFGAPVGRCANRISMGHFFINGKEYKLDQNDETNCLHGGFLRYNHLMYDAEYEAGDGEDSLSFFRLSPDGEQHFPGNFSYRITYRLTDADELIVEYDGVSDQDTVVNMTNHSYFNLGPGGHKCGTVLDQEVKIFSDKYTPINELLVPTGEICPVKGTPLDFSEFKILGTDVVSDESRPDYFKGYDHNFVLEHPKGEIVEALIYRAPSTGRMMKVFTDQPGVQMYTAPELEGEEGKEGVIYGPSSAVCFECQNFADAVNIPAFPDAVLKAGENYHHVTIFQFSIYEG